MVSPKQLQPWSYKPQERATAKAEGKTTYFTGRPCKNGHLTFRQTASGSCVDCAKVFLKKSRTKRSLNNPNWHKEYYAKNPELHKQKTAKYRLEHPEKVRETQLLSMRKRKPQKTAAERARQANKLKATPLWLTKNDYKEMEAVYISAKKTSTFAGFDCHVDHIVPLKGKDVCGLHVPWNLRVVSRSYNIKKFNHLDNGILFAPSQKGGVLVHESALPWNWRK
jgi:hypothetical protein